MNLTDIKAALQAHFEQQQYQILVQEGEDFLLEQEGDAALHLLLAQAYLSLRNYADAEFHALKAKAVESSNIEALFLLAQISLQTDETSKAQRYYDQILALQPENNRAHELLGDAYRIGRQDALALQAYRKGLPHFKGEQRDDVVFKIAAIYLQIRHLEEGISLLNQEIGERFVEPLEQLRRKFYIAMGSEMREALLTSTRRLQTAVPTNPQYAIDLAQLIGDEAEAMELYSQALNQEVNVVQRKMLLKERAYLRLTLEDWIGAIEDYDALLEDEDNWFYYQKRASAKEHLKDAKGAVQDLNKALSLQEEPLKGVLEQRALLFARAGAHDKAITDFKQLIKQHEGLDDARWYYHLGIVYNKKGDKKEAVKMLLHADTHGNQKAADFLQQKFPKQVLQVRGSTRKKLQATYEAEWPSNEKSELLQKAFGKLWVPDMNKLIEGSREELLQLPKSIVESILETISKDLLLLTPEGLLWIEGEEAPLEAFYSIEVESEYAILLEIQATKGGPSSQMRLSFYEDNLLLSYPVTEMDTPAKYFLPVTSASPKQLERLSKRPLDMPYLPSIEAAIAALR